MFSGNSSSSIYLPPCVPSKQPSRLPSPPRGVMKTLNPWGYEENPDAKSLSIWAEKTRCQNRSSLGAVMHPQKPAQTQDKISHAAKSGTESRCTGIADASKDNSVSNITNMGFFPILSQDVRRNNFTLDQQLPLGIDTSVKSVSFEFSCNLIHESCVQVFLEEECGASRWNWQYKNMVPLSKPTPPLRLEPLFIHVFKSVNSQIT